MQILKFERLKEILKNVKVYKTLTKMQITKKMQI